MFTILHLLSETNWHLAVKIFSYLLVLLTFVGVVGTILLENRNPIKAMAYILLLVFLPLVGLVV